MIEKRTFNIIDVEFFTHYPLISQFCSCSSPKKCSFPTDCIYKGMESFDEYWAKNFRPELRVTVENKETGQKLVGTISGSIKWAPLIEGNENANL